MTLVEGHGDYVMDAVGPQVVPSVAEIREKFNSRRGTAGRVEQTVRRLLGIDLKMKQYAEGSRFVTAVVDEIGMAGFNQVWDSPETLPTLAEIQDPRAWITRVAPAYLRPAALPAPEGQETVTGTGPAGSAAPASSNGSNGSHPSPAAGRGHRPGGVPAAGASGRYAAPPPRRRRPRARPPRRRPRHQPRGYLPRRPPLRSRARRHRPSRLQRLLSHRPRPSPNLRLRRPRTHRPRCSPTRRAGVGRATNVSVRRAVGARRPTGFGFH